MKPGIRHEHEFEPQYGLPERLPAGERILWQGAPDWPSLARRAFHLNKLAVYFAILLGLRATVVLADGGTAADVLRAVLMLGSLFAIGLAIVASLAWLAARTTAYTITDKRVVMRIGIVLSATYNLPFARIEGAHFASHGSGSGDIAIALLEPDRIAWLQLWPHARPWHLARTQPMLRSLPDGERVAALLSRAWAEATGLVARPARPAGAEPIDIRPVWVPRSS
jgi:hypothetical protein